MIACRHRERGGGGVFQWQPPLHQLLNCFRGSSYSLIFCRRTRGKSKSKFSANADTEAEVTWRCALRQCQVIQDSRLGDSARLELRAGLPDKVLVYIRSIISSLVQDRYLVYLAFMAK